MLGCPVRRRLWNAPNRLKPICSDTAPKRETLVLLAYPLAAQKEDERILPVGNEEMIGISQSPGDEFRLIPKRNGQDSPVLPN